MWFIQQAGLNASAQGDPLGIWGWESHGIVVSQRNPMSHRSMACFLMGQSSYGVLSHEKLLGFRELIKIAEFNFVFAKDIAPATVICC